MKVTASALEPGLAGLDTSRFAVSWRRTSSVDSSTHDPYGGRVGLIDLVVRWLRRHARELTQLAYQINENIREVASAKKPIHEALDNGPRIHGPPAICDTRVRPISSTALSRAATCPIVRRPTDGLARLDGLV